MVYHLCVNVRSYNSTVLLPQWYADKNKIFKEKEKGG